MYTSKFWETLNILFSERTYFWINWTNSFISLNLETELFLRIAVAVLCVGDTDSIYHSNKLSLHYFFLISKVKQVNCKYLPFSDTEDFANTTVNRMDITVKQMKPLIGAVCVSVGDAERSCIIKMQYSCVFYLKRSYPWPSINPPQKYIVLQLHFWNLLNA